MRKFKVPTSTRGLESIQVKPSYFFQETLGNTMTVEKSMTLNLSENEEE